MQTLSPFSRLAGCGLVAIATLVGGCATNSAPLVTESPLIEEVVFAPAQAEPELIPVVRYGRYTLVELAPTTAQRDLLLQVIDVRMPDDARASVGDGLRHVLKRSGYQMCETAHTVIELYSLPMPAAHLQLGPMTLRDALLTLVGPAWDVEVNDSARQVCFVRPGSRTDQPPQDLPTVEADQPIPLANGTQP
ncbi:PilL N-terminal domain-containing protein [Pseudomonas amygdali]|uniref:PFGI-1 class ICE element type IV pilus protein PilL2 n=1 Tax=Pseudomonas amygdali TaxID=47877 RepID=UPI001CD864A0|nr:PilL N-terminal domain-containing protein [Pseudomonas amygdali]UBT80407.1 PilL N-terminal domain-containing protein [Pseudomonas amygdali]